MHTEKRRLSDFWNERYTKFTLQESGIKGLSDKSINYYYECKKQAYEKALKHLTFNISKTTVFDAGCGQGFFYELSQKLGFEKYLGLDISDKSIFHLQQIFPEGKWQQGDFCDNISNIGEKYDLIQSIEVMHLIIDDLYHSKGLDNLASLMKKESVLLITDILPAIRYKANEYIVFRPMSYYINFCKERDMEIVDIIPIYYWIPNQGIRKFPLNYIFNKLSPELIYRMDRFFLKIGLPQIWQNHDSKMKMIVIKNKK